MRLAVLLVAAVLVSPIHGQEKPQEAKPTGPKPSRVEITPRTVETVAGQQLTFSAAGYDEAGDKMDAQPSAWFAAPFDLAFTDDKGTVTFTGSGDVRVGAIINGKSGFIVVTVRPQAVARVTITKPRAALAVGTGLTLQAHAEMANGDPRTDQQVKWVSLRPDVASIDESGFVVGQAVGTAMLQASVGDVKASTSIDVVRNPVRELSITPKTTRARTGDVVRFESVASGQANARVSAVARWSVSGIGATIDADGGFVAEKPGSYAVTATIGDRSAVASVTVVPREVARELEVVGRTPQEEFQAAEQWIIGKYAYLSSIMAGRVWVYDISDPAKPVKVDSVSFDARVINDVSTTADGRIGVITREGASNRKNGIVFLDLADPAHPKVLSEYTETVTGGVHSAYVNGHYVYLTDDATGSLRVIDFADPAKPKEVARWQTENPLSRPVKNPEGETFIGGRMLHDVQVVDGLIYMGYWKDGLVILDVGNGIKGGSPEHPQFVSQLRFNYSELYGPGWLAGAHSVFRYKNYVFLGDEVFPVQFDLTDKARIPTKGVVHVVDVSDILNPRKVAEYDVPEEGAHNMWVENDVMYIGYYSGGARVVDVSGELRGNLYRQGREMARLWTGDAKGFRPNIPFAWGAQPHDGLIYFNDIHTGIWATKMVDPAERATQKP
ncbi:MAG TPA: Ig-like domain-containing protein [Vicinamibacterales bacterium]|nr:Ig-like domain-containing protein [Vicinamibacterales bacterium]